VSLALVRILGLLQDQSNPISSKTWAMLESDELWQLQVENCMRELAALR